MPDAKKAVDIFQAFAKGIKIILISALTGEGIDNLKSKIVQSLDKLDKLDE
jgi:translation initiation factor IF-2